METDQTTVLKSDATAGSVARSEFTGWHAATIALLALGYAGYYFCRSNLSVVLPELIHDLAQHGITPSEAQVRLGFIASVGTIVYAGGKFVSGSMADLFGGRRNFLVGMAGSVFFTILFALGGGFPLFTLAWIGNRLAQSTGWVGLVKVASRWFSYSTYGTIMAVLSLSFLFGDAACRWAMSRLMGSGSGLARGIFLRRWFDGNPAAGQSHAMRETPEERGLPAPEVSPLNVYASEQEQPNGKASGTGRHPSSAPGELPVLARLPAFAGTTLLRETFNFWMPTYFRPIRGFLDAARPRAAVRSFLCWAGWRCCWPEW